MSESHTRIMVYEILSEFDPLNFNIIFKVCNSDVQPEFVKVDLEIAVIQASRGHNSHLQFCDVPDRHDSLTLG